MPPSADEFDFDRELLNLEQEVLRLKARHAQIQLDQQQQQDLLQQQRVVEGRLKGTRSRVDRTALTSELKQIKQQLEELEANLESQLFSWSGLKEVFWQAVRFGGMGIVIGWLLRSIAVG